MRSKFEIGRGGGCFRSKGLRGPFGDIYHCVTLARSSNVVGAAGVEIAWHELWKAFSKAAPYKGLNDDTNRTDRKYSEVS